MARKFKVGLDYFPVFELTTRSNSKLGHSDKRVGYKVLRNASSGFIAKKDVRKIVFDRDSNKCKSCGSIENLQIDHIISVNNCWFKNQISISELNSLQNLQTLCKSCNSAKEV